MNDRIYLIIIMIIALMFSCKDEQSSINTFDDKVLFIENDPHSYLSRIDTTGSPQIRNGKEATDFILSALTLNYISEDCYPSKEQLQASIRIFKTEKLVQQQLEAQYLLAGVYRKEKDLTNEVHVIEEAIDLANQEGDNEWLFYLYSYLGEMYINQFNMFQFVKYLTLANQCIMDIGITDMSLSTKIQFAKNLLYTEHYHESYKILKELEYNVGKNNTYYNDIKRLLGVVLYKMNQLDSCIEKLNDALATEKSLRHLFTCHSILSYCYYTKKDLIKAELHKKLAKEYDTDDDIRLSEIEFYTLCAEFAKANDNQKEQIDCLDKVKECYTSALDYISGQSLDEAIQVYTRIHEKRMFNKQIATYRYIITGFLLIVCISLIVYIKIRKKQIYKILALQRQIDSLENLRNIKDDVKGFIMRDFEIAKKIAILRNTQQVQSAKFLKDLEKHHIIEGNDLLTMNWEQFYKDIDLSFDGFYSNLTKEYPTLNEKEIQLCCMLMSGFKTNEIAAIWMNSVFSVHKYKTNVRKKINAPEGSDIIVFLSEKSALQ
jgi:DNA-binding CsgD family transcriptional regulator